MTKKKLWTFDIVDGKVELKQDEYNVDLEGIHVLKESLCGRSGWNFLSDEAYNRIYGDRPSDVISNSRKWLIEIVLPIRLKELKKVTDEIAILSEWLNKNG